MKFRLICILSLMTAAVHAQKLSITMVGNAAVRIVIDDRNYICQDNSLTIDDLTPGYHSVRLFVVRKDRWNNSASSGQLVYNANVILKSQFYTDIVVNRFGKTMIDEQPFTRGDFYDNMDGQPLPPPRPGNNNPRSPQQMTDADFTIAYNAIRKESFDNNKVAIAKQIADNNYFTAAQVKELLGLFSFEDRKVDFAKYAYGKTIDRNNYFILNDAFSFSKSKDELANYIRNF